MHIAVIDLIWDRPEVSQPRIVIEIKGPKEGVSINPAVYGEVSSVDSAHRLASSTELKVTALQSLSDSSPPSLPSTSLCLSPYPPPLPSLEKLSTDNLKTVFELEQLYLFKLPEDTLLSTKNIRTEPSSMASYLCHQITNELQADFSVLNAGCFRLEDDFPVSRAGQPSHFTALMLFGIFFFDTDLVVKRVQGKDVTALIESSWKEKPGTGQLLMLLNDDDDDNEFFL